jgi:ribose transport system permease protein
MERPIRNRLRTIVSRLTSDYGMLLVLLVLCTFLSWITWSEQVPTGAPGGREVARDIAASFDPGARILIATRNGDEDRQFADELASGLANSGFSVVGIVAGAPSDAGQTIRGIFERGDAIDVIACNHATRQWPVFDALSDEFPQLATAKMVAPRSYYWPNFLKTDNLLNVANQIVVIAVVAIGMTMVIITAGIDLSVGSLIALSAVTSALLIRDVAGAGDAGVAAMLLCCLAGIGICAALGAFSGAMVGVFAVPPFIATLGMMLVASGLAYILATGQSIYQVPESFIWLGRGTSILSIPNSVVMMLLLYAAAHVLMTHTTLGRHIYAIGGNPEAARLSGVPVRRVLLCVYTICGALAGLGGIVTASQLKSGSPTYGLMYELYVIAAVVVGGTSLAGGQGRIFGTLIGAFIIAVVRNGMNLTEVESYTQKVVLGLVVLGAVLLDTAKRRGLTFANRGRS